MGLKWAILGLDLPSASHSLCDPREKAPELLFHSIKMMNDFGGTSERFWKLWSRFVWPSSLPLHVVAPAWKLSVQHIKTSLSFAVRHLKQSKILIAKVNVLKTKQKNPSFLKQWIGQGSVDEIKTKLFFEIQCCSVEVGIVTLRRVCGVGTVSCRSWICGHPQFPSVAKTIGLIDFLVS